MVKIIQKQKPVINSLCGEQTYFPDKSWRLSRHIIRVDCDDGILLYHTLTGVIVLLSSDEYNNIESNNEVRELLGKNWFLIPNDFDEKKHSKEIRAILKSINGTSTNITNFTILSTTACNARCYYCFEQGVTHHSMSSDTALKTAQYIEKSSGGQKISIRWFGGEPLCNISAIRTICSYLANHDLDYTSSITTNGYYLTPEISQEAVTDWHLTSAQIAIDGTKDVYESTKRYVNGSKDSFERILTNIDGALSAGITVIARLNMDVNNSDNLSLLLDELNYHFAGKERFEVSIIPLQNFTVDIAEFNRIDDKEKAYYHLADKAKKNNFITQSSLSNSYRINKCRADNDSCEVILPDGNIAKCFHYLAGPYIGTIFSPERNNHEINEWKTEKPDFPECDSCPLYPNCIKIKRCAWTNKGCNAFSRKMKIQKQQELVLFAYKRYKENVG